MKLYMEPIEVTLANGVPTALRWRNRWYRVQGVTERWTYRGRWWTDPPTLEGERRTYYRVLCDRASFEIFHLSAHAATSSGNAPDTSTPARGQSGAPDTSTPARGQSGAPDTSTSARGHSGALPSTSSSKPPGTTARRGHRPWTLSRALD